MAGARPTCLSLTPPVRVLLDGVEHAARRPLLVHPEPFQALQVQSSEDLSGTCVVGTHPVALLTGHSRLQAGDKACGHVSKLLSQGLWGPVCAVPPFALAYPGPRDLEHLAAGSPGGRCLRRRRRRRSAGSAPWLLTALRRGRGAPACAALLGPSAGAFSGRGRGPRRRRLRSFLFSRAPNGRVQSKLSAHGAARLSQPAAAAQPALELHPRRS